MLLAERQKRLRLHDGRLARHAAVLQAQAQLFFHGGEDDLVVRVLEHQAHHAGQLLALALHIVAGYHHLALARHLQPAEQAEEAGFARAVIADQANAALGQAQAQAGKHGLGAACQVHVLQLDT